MKTFNIVNFGCRASQSEGASIHAGLFAVQILALTDEVLAAKLKDYKSQLEKTVAEKSKKVQESL